MRSALASPPSKTDHREMTPPDDLGASAPSHLPFDPICLITGAASGIGAASARRIARYATGGLILVDKDEDGLSATADSLSDAPERVSLLTVDVSSPERWGQAQAFLAEQYGRVDWGVACAGVAHAMDLTDLAFEDWRSVLATNLDGAFLTLQTLMRLMRDGRPARGGSIVVLSSAAAHRAEAGVAAYGASKAGVEHLARVAAKEGAPHGVRVNVIAPGGVETPMWRSVPMFQDLVREAGSERAAFDQIAALATPLARYATADDIARMVEALLIDPAPITGATVRIDGGYSL